MPVIKFVKEKKEIEVPMGANLRAEAVKAGVSTNCMISGISSEVDKAIHTVSDVINCHGFGMCGTCRIKITKGAENTNSMTLTEQAHFKYLPLPNPIPALMYISNEETLRLACKTKVLGDIEVETRPELDIFGENFFS